MMTPEKNFKGKTRKDYAQNFTVHHQKLIATKEAINQRRNLVYQLKLQDYSVEQISSELKVSTSTIEKDLHYMKFYCLKWCKDIITVNARKPFVDSYTQIEIVQKELWNLYRAEKDAKIKKKILDSIISNALKQDNLVQYKRLRDEEEKSIEELEVALDEEAEKELGTS